MNDLRPLWVIALRTVLPAALGALGAIFATVAPVFHQTFCAGSL